GVEGQPGDVHSRAQRQAQARVVTQDRQLAGGASGAMSIYQRYLANQTPTPLVLTVPEDVVDMGVDSNGNFVCSGALGH
ncbi:hypothetical protein FK514_29775, partial [Klebsiella pneumoniae]|nr:hypothetical protein [Klebsiella pneumoniae]